MAGLEIGAYRKGSRRLWKFILNSCLLATLSFFLTWSIFPSVHHFAKTTKEHHTARIGTLVSADGISYFIPNPFSPKESQVIIENLTEPEDNIQMDDYGVCCHEPSFVAVPHTVLLNKILSTLPAPFLQNRTEVPLFVLHHSWKNFLS